MQSQGMPTDAQPTAVTITKSPDGTFSVTDQAAQAPQMASTIDEALQIAKSLLMGEQGEQNEQDSFNAVFKNKQRPEMMMQSKPGMMR